MKKRLLWLGLSFLLVASLVLTSCGEAVPGEQEEEEITPTTLPAGMGIIKVYVTDPPHPPFISIVVFIDPVEGIKVHKVAPGEPPEWISVEPVVSSFDLVSLVGVSEFLGSVEVTAGSFTQIRIAVEKVEVNGELATLPSDTLRIVRPFEVSEGMITTLELDVNGERSVITTGRGKFIFKPVLHLKVTHSSVPATGEDTTPPITTLTGVDTTPPEITLEGVTEGQVIVSPDTVTPVFSASDDTDPAPTVTATLNGEPFTSGTVVSEVDEYELEVTAIDASDNETEVAVNFEIVAVEDTTPPVITLEGVIEGEVIVSPGTVTPVFTVSDDIDPEPILIATLNGEPFTSGTVVSEVDEYELVVTAIDASGNEAEVAVNFDIVAE